MKISTPVRAFFISAVIILTGTASAGVRFDFFRNNQTYDWLTAFDYSIARPGFEFKSGFNGESNLVKGPLDRWQENATATADAKRSLIKGLSLVTLAEYKVNGLDKRRVRSSELAAGLSYQAGKIFEVRPMIRIDRIKRSDLDRSRNDQGVGYALETGLLPSKLLGATLGGSISYNRINLTNIPSDEGSGSFNALANLRQADTIWASIRALEAAKKYYGTAGTPESIAKQIKQEREGSMAASLALPASLRFRVDGNAHLSRYLYRYSTIEGTAAPQRDNYGRGGGYKAGLLGHVEGVAHGVVSYAWGRARQDYQGLELDQKTEMGELSFLGRLRLSARDSVSADAVFGVTSYSNPSVPANRQDRDQKTVVINGRFRHEFSRFFAAGVSGGASSFHQLYVSGVQSANNSRNDTYIMTPFAQWLPFDRLQLSQMFDIQANYITFDYDRKKLATKNRIFRRASSRTDMRFIVDERFTWEQAYLYRYEDYGQLVWDEGWQQAVSWDRKRSGLETKFIYAPNRIVRVAPSFAWEKTGDFTHGVETDTSTQELREIRSLSDEQVKLLFGLELVFNWGDARRLRADFSHRVRKFMSRPRELTDYATVSMEYLF